MGKCSHLHSLNCIFAAVVELITKQNVLDPQFLLVGASRGEKKAFAFSPPSSPQFQEREHSPYFSILLEDCWTVRAFLHHMNECWAVCPSAEPFAGA